MILFLATHLTSALFPLVKVSLGLKLLLFLLIVMLAKSKSKNKAWQTTLQVKF